MKIPVVIGICLALAIIPLARGAQDSMEFEVTVTILEVIDPNTFKLEIKDYEAINEEKGFDATVSGCTLKETEEFKISTSQEINENAKETLIEELKKTYEGKEATIVVNYAPKYEKHLIPRVNLEPYAYEVLRGDGGVLAGSLTVDGNSIAEEVDALIPIINSLVEWRPECSE